MKTQDKRKHHKSMAPTKTNNVPQAVTDEKQPVGAAKRKRRYRPGTVAMREIKKMQQGTKLLIPRMPFARFCRETLQDVFKFPASRSAIERFSPGAIKMLQEVSESFLIEVFGEANISAIKDNRITIMPEDVRMFLRMKYGDTSEYNTDVFKAMDWRKRMELRAKNRADNEIILTGVKKPVTHKVVVNGVSSSSARTPTAKKVIKTKVDKKANNSGNRERPTPTENRARVVEKAPKHQKQEAPISKKATPQTNDEDHSDEDMQDYSGASEVHDLEKDHDEDDEDFSQDEDPNSDEYGEEIATESGADEA
jgi:histone H3/H4